MSLPLLKKALSDINLDALAAEPNGGLSVVGHMFQSSGRQVALDRLVRSMETKLKTPIVLHTNVRTDLIVATNRVALWRFFERYVVPAMAASGHPGYKNPFASSANLLPVILKGWQPLMIKESRKYASQVGNGSSLMDEFMSVAILGLLEGLERQAMDIIAMSKKAQLIPFHLKLKYAIQRHMLQHLPTLTEGGFRYSAADMQQYTPRPTIMSLDDPVIQNFLESPSDWEELDE